MGAIRREPAQPTILVVEDQFPVRRFIRRALRRRGFQVREAASAEEGLSIFQAYQGSIDLAILDIVMTGMSGLDLAAELIRERPLFKILYISGYADSVAMETLGRMSPEAVLAKPFTSVALMERVEQLLLGRVARAPGSDT
jgi:two-component system cell cycle sensor histidine kinase/response regulator CckA